MPSPAASVATITERLRSKNSRSASKGQADVAVLGLHRPLEIMLHVIGDGFIELQFIARQLVRERLDLARREARRAVELLHVLLESPDHDPVLALSARLGQNVARDVQILVE